MVVSYYDIMYLYTDLMKSLHDKDQKESNQKQICNFKQIRQGKNSLRAKVKAPPLKSAPCEIWLLQGFIGIANCKSALPWTRSIICVYQHRHMSLKKLGIIETLLGMLGHGSVWPVETFAHNFTKRSINDPCCFINVTSSLALSLPVHFLPVW